MREVAVNHGLQSAKDALKAYSRIIYKIMSTGTQVAGSGYRRSTASSPTPTR